MRARVAFMGILFLSGGGGGGGEISGLVGGGEGRGGGELVFGGIVPVLFDFAVWVDCVGIYNYTLEIVRVLGMRICGFAQGPFFFTSLFGLD